METVAQSITRSMTPLEHIEFEDKVIPVVSNEDQMEMTLAERTIKEETHDLDQKEEEMNTREG